MKAHRRVEASLLGHAVTDLRLNMKNLIHMMTSSVDTLNRLDDRLMDTFEIIRAAEVRVNARLMDVYPLFLELGIRTRPSPVSFLLTFAPSYILT